MAESCRWRSYFSINLKIKDETGLEVQIFSDEPCSSDALAIAAAVRAYIVYRLRKEPVVEFRADP